jgi:hypothetical protein
LIGGPGSTGPGDAALLNALLVTMNSSLGPQGIGQDAWFAYLQAIGAQGITTQNTSRPAGAPPITGGPVGGSPGGGPNNPRGPGSGP